MIKFKGTTLFAPALFDLLTAMEDVTDFVAEVFSNEIGTDEVLLHLLPVEIPKIRSPDPFLFTGKTQGDATGSLYFT